MDSLLTWPNLKLGLGQILHAQVHIHTYLRQQQMAVATRWPHLGVEGRDGN